MTNGTKIKLEIVHIADAIEVGPILRRSPVRCKRSYCGEIVNIRQIDGARARHCTCCDQVEPATPTRRRQI